TPTMSGDGKFVVTPMDMGLRVAGTVELAGLKAAPNWARADNLLRQVKEMYPGLARDIPEARISRWMGHRPSFPDSLPVIDRSGRSDQVFYAFGHGHTGLAGGATTGKIIADLIAGRPPDIDIAPFSRARFNQI